MASQLYIPWTLSYRLVLWTVNYRLVLWTVSYWLVLWPVNYRLVLWTVSYKYDLPYIMHLYSPPSFKTCKHFSCPNSFGSLLRRLRFRSKYTSCLSAPIFSGSACSLLLWATSLCSFVHWVMDSGNTSRSEHFTTRSARSYGKLCSHVTG